MGDDFPLESVLNLSKCLGFPTPTAATVQAVIKALSSLDGVDSYVGAWPNRQCGWGDYLKLYLLYLLWGFPSQVKFNKFLRKSTAFQKWLRLEKRPVQAQTFLAYIRQLEMLPGAAERFQEIFQQVLQISLIRKRRPTRGRPKELGELYGILGNNHGAKDPGARPHYQASKGRYFFGRIGRILVDTWSQIPIWASLTSAGQPLAWELEAFGEKVTELLADKVKPLLVLFDSWFQGEARWQALRHGFRTVWKILFTQPYKWAKPSKNIIRIERLAVEREIGHLTIQLDLETPPYRGTTAIQGWVLGSVYLQQLGALWNAAQMPLRPVTGLVHFRA